MSEKTFLVEIGTEELPPKALRSLAESFAANFTAELDNAGLAHGTATGEMPRVESIGSTSAAAVITPNALEPVTI